MINPQPVHGASSPYAKMSGRPAPARLTPQRPPRRFLRIFLMCLVSVVVAGGTYAFAKLQSATSGVLLAHQGDTSSSILSYDPNNKSSLQVSQFQNVGDGRFNILVVGVGGVGHDGAYLTDSIQIASLDTINKKITYTSVPRDLLAKIPGYGNAKVNTAYEYGEMQKSGSGPLVDKEVISNILGVRISDFVLIDFTAAKDVVNDLGGIDVTVPTILSDPLYPCPDPSTAYCPIYFPAGATHLNGDQALEYARSRETTTDFDRSARQQIVVEAIKKKALSLGFLANPAKVLDVVSALGQHVKTDLSVSQISSLIGTYQSAQKAGSFVLDTTPQEGLLTSVSDPVLGYLEEPVAGAFNYTAIHSWFAKNNPDPLIGQENPTIVVAGNGRATNAQLQAAVATLQDYGYTASLSTTTASASATATTVYDTTKDSKPVTRNYLGSFYKTTVKDGSPLSSGATYEIIYVPTTSS